MMPETTMKTPEGSSRDRSLSSSSMTPSPPPRGNSSHHLHRRREGPPVPPQRTRSASPSHRRLPLRYRSSTTRQNHSYTDDSNNNNHHCHHSAANASSSICCCAGKSHFFVLFTGMLLGYLLLPVLLIEVQLTDFLDRFPEQPQGPPPTVREQNYFLRTTESRALDGVLAANNKNNNNNQPKPGNNMPHWQQEQQQTMASDVEQRLMEDHDVLARQSMPTATTPYVMKTKTLPDHQRFKILVTGGAGFVGSHLVDKLMMEGHEVIVVDNFFTGQKKNIAHWLHHPLFSVIVHDVTEPIQLEVDQIYHLACPASPPHYQYNPVKTIKTSTMGTLNMLGLAKRVRARILLTSTSEIYGDPEVHPQPETYWGNVNTVGPRSCYDEGKRVAETMMYSYKNQNRVEIRVARIFNTFGPRMHPNDGRVVSNFIIQALQNKNMTIYGNGEQTRSFQYVSDLVEGLHKLMNGSYDQPVNLGNPEEFTVKKFAVYIKEMAASQSEIIHLPKSQDDPQQRQPDISTAKREIGWEPQVKVHVGLQNTIDYFARVLKEAGEIIPTGPGAAKPEA